MSKTWVIAAGLGLILTISTFDADARPIASGNKVSGQKSTKQKGPATKKPPATDQGGGEIITGPTNPSGGHVKPF
jgi:hypothetical protein